MTKVQPMVFQPKGVSGNFEPYYPPKYQNVSYTVPQRRVVTEQIAPRQLTNSKSETRGS